MGVLSSIKIAIVAGETCHHQTIQTHRGAIPYAELHNEYGPTEATVWCIAGRIDQIPTTELMPIGRPIEGVRIRIFDPTGQPVSPGVVGEIYIEGEGVLKDIGMTML